MQQFLEGTCKSELSTAANKDLGVRIKAVIGYMYTAFTLALFSKTLVYCSYFALVFVSTPLSHEVGQYGISALALDLIGTILE